MSTEIANAYIALYTQMPGVKKDIEKAIGGAEPAADKAGASVGGKFSDAFGGIAKTALLVGGGAAIAALGITLTKGFERLSAIDQARAKLTGLGNDASVVDSVMDSALASVKGTAFGLGDAALVAAQAVAAGIKPGEALEGVLKGVANSAAAAGTDLGTMGSIYASVASSGRAYNDVLGQIANQGIPIYQALADQLGVSVDQVRELASAGQIGFEEFSSAAAAASGTVADEMGTTLQGRLDNTMAALSRLGEGLIEGIFPQMKDGLGGITGALDDLLPVAQSVGETVGNFFRFIGDNISWIGPLAAGIGIVVAAIGVWTGVQWLLNAALTANPIGLIIVAIGALVGAIIWLVQNWDAVVAWITAVWGGFISWITGVIDGFVGWWNGIWAAVGQWISDVWNGIVTAVTTYFNALFAGFQIIGAAIMGWWNGLWNGIASFFGGIWNGIIGTIQNVQNAFSMVFNAIGGIVRGAFEGVVGFVRGVINGIVDAVNGVIGGINGVVGAVGGALGFEVSIPRIPRLAEGATVLPRRGGTLAVLAEAGRAESVVDTGLMNRALEQGLAGGSSGEATFNIYDVNGVLLGAMRGEIQKSDRSSTRSMRGRVSPNG